MVRTMLYLFIMIFIFCLVSCDFFMDSAFPNYLPSVRWVENLGDYFKDSDFYDYDMFVMDEGPPDSNDFVFLLYKPSDTERKVVVLNNNLHVVSEYEHANLGSLHTHYDADITAAVERRAAVGSRSMIFKNFSWDANDINGTLSVEKNNKIIFNRNTNSFISLSFSSAGTESRLYWTTYDSNLLNPINGSTQIDNTSQYYSLESVGYAINNENQPVPTDDDEVIIFLRRQSDGQGIAIAIPAADFPIVVAEPVISFYVLSTFNLGKIKPNTVHLLFGGMSVIVEKSNGSLQLYQYRRGLGFNGLNDVNGDQFRDKVVAYSYIHPEYYYVFDPKTKEIFKCDVWWKKQLKVIRQVIF